MAKFGSHIKFLDYNMNEFKRIFLNNLIIFVYYLYIVLLGLCQNSGYIINQDAEEILSTFL